jgi:Flp pilus assembly protein TadD
MMKTLLLINYLELAGALIFIILALVQIIKRGWHGRVMRWAATFTFVALLAGVAFGRYYASTVPKRLQAIEKSDPQVAIRTYTEAIRLSPSDPALYYSRGMMNVGAGRYGDALADLTRSLELSPSDPVTLAGRGMILAGLHDRQSADRDFDKAAALYAGKNTPDALTALAMIAEMRGQLDSTVIFATQALSRGPDASDRCAALLYRAFAYMSRSKDGDVENALRDSSEAENVCNGPMKEDAIVSHAEAFSRLRQFNRAVDALSKALLLRPDDWAVLYNRGLALTEMGQFALALADLNRAIDLRPSEPAAYRARGELYSKLGDKVRSESDLAMASKLLADGNVPGNLDVFFRHGGLDWTQLALLQNDNR